MSCARLAPAGPLAPSEPHPAHKPATTSSAANTASPIPHSDLSRSYPATTAAFYGAECPVFYPTLEQFKQLTFAQFIAAVEPLCGAAGVCRVVPPAGWFMHPSGYAGLDGLEVTTPAQQVVSGRAGVYSLDLVETATQSLRSFREAALRRDAACGNEEARVVREGESESSIDRRFWRGLNTTMEPALYGADSVGSLFGGDDACGWNVDKLDTVLQQADVNVPGVSSSMLYVGMWQAMFAFHTEDLDLYSINYIHFGRPKSWWFVPPDPQHRKRFESVMGSYFPEQARACPEYLRHKTSMISPARLQRHGIPYTKVVQRAGEFVLTFPGAYHAGYNQGFNVAESANFASPTWLSGAGRLARVCKCRPFVVRIDFDWLQQVVAAADAASEAKQARAAVCKPSSQAAAHADATPDRARQAKAARQRQAFFCVCRTQCCYPPPPPALAPSAVGMEIFKCAACGLCAHVACYEALEQKLRQHGAAGVGEGDGGGESRLCLACQHIPAHVLRNAGLPHDLLEAASLAPGSLGEEGTCNGLEDALPAQQQRQQQQQQQQEHKENGAGADADELREALLVAAYLRRTYSVAPLEAHRAAQAKIEQQKAKARAKAQIAKVKAKTKSKPKRRARAALVPDAYDWDECAVAPPAARHEAKCAFCGGLDGACNGALRMLPRPIVLDADADGRPTRSVWVHAECAVHAAEVRTMVPPSDPRDPQLKCADANDFSQPRLCHVAAAVKRGRSMRCTVCGERGAVLGCLVSTCKVNVHLRCAMELTQQEPGGSGFGAALAPDCPGFLCAAHSSAYALPSADMYHVRAKPERKSATANAGATDAIAEEGDIAEAQQAKKQRTVVRKLRSLLRRPKRADLELGATLVVHMLGPPQVAAEQLHDAIVVGAEDQFVRLHFRKSKPKSKVKAKAKAKTKTKLQTAEQEGEDERTSSLEDEWMVRTSHQLHVLAPIKEKEAADLVWQADEHLVVRSIKPKGCSVKAKAKMSVKGEARAGADGSCYDAGGPAAAGVPGLVPGHARAHALQRVQTFVNAIRQCRTTVCRSCELKLEKRRLALASGSAARVAAAAAPPLLLPVPPSKRQKVPADAATAPVARQLLDIVVD